MIDVSAAWKSSMNQNTAYTTSATITLADETVLAITPAEVCVNTNRFTDGPGVSTFPVGEAMCRTIQIELDNSREQYAAVNFYDASIELYLNYGEESITIGRFTVRTPVSYGETVIITAQDDMYKADRAFATSLTYPTTAATLWAEICTNCGLVDGMTSIPQASYTIDTAPSSDLTYRAVIGYIAMLSGGNARISRAGELEIVNYDFTGLATERTAGTAQNIHNLTYWRSLQTDLDDVTITGVHATVYSGDGTYEDALIGSSGYVIELSNPLFAGHLQSALQAVGLALIGGRVRGFTGEYIAYPLAEFGDGARVTDRKGNQFWTVLTDIDFTWSQPTILQTTAAVPLENATKYVPTDSRSMQGVEKTDASIGALSGLETTAQSTLVAAINEVLARAEGRISMLDGTPVRAVVLTRAEYEQMAEDGTLERGVLYFPADEV